MYISLRPSVNQSRGSTWRTGSSWFHTIPAVATSCVYSERLLTARVLSQLRKISEYMLGVCQWRYGAFCVSRQHRLRRRWPRRILMCLFIVCETKFTIGESRTISHANDTPAQQVAPNPRPGRFFIETPLERVRSWRLTLFRQTWPLQSRNMSTSYILLILGAIMLSFNEEKFVKQQKLSMCKKQ